MWESIAMRTSYPSPGRLLISVALSLVPRPFARVKRVLSSEQQFLSHGTGSMSDLRLYLHELRDHILFWTKFEAVKCCLSLFLAVPIGFTQVFANGVVRAEVVIGLVPWLSKCTMASCRDSSTGLFFKKCNFMTFFAKYDPTLCDAPWPSARSSREGLGTRLLLY